MTHYQENPESFQKEINELNQLREVNKHLDNIN